MNPPPQYAALYEKLRPLAELYARTDLATALWPGSTTTALSRGWSTTLIDHFLEEYFFRPSAIVCYSPGAFGGVRAAMQLPAMLAEGGDAIDCVDASRSLRGRRRWNEDGVAATDDLAKRSKKFWDEFAWYMRALKAGTGEGCAVLGQLIVDS